MLQYSKSFRAIRHRTESLYDRARRKFHASFRSGSARRRRSAANIEHFVVVEDFVATQEGQISLAKGQIVELVEQCAESPDWILVALESEDGKETTQGLAPLKVLTSVAESGVVSTSRSLVAARAIAGCQLRVRSMEPIPAPGRAEADRVRRSRVVPCLALAPLPVSVAALPGAIPHRSGAPKRRMKKMKRSKTVDAHVPATQRGAASPSTPQTPSPTALPKSTSSKKQRWSFAFKRKWFSSTSSRSSSSRHHSEDLDSPLSAPPSDPSRTLAFPSLTVLGPSANASPASDATDRPSIGEPVSPGASGVVKRKSIRRFFNHSNGANSSAAQSGRPSSSVSLSVNHSAQPSSSAAHNRLSAAEPLQPEPSTSSSPNQESRPSPTCVLSTFPSDSGTLLQEPAPSPPDPNPSAVELPPPMSQLSSVVVDAASHLASPLMDEAVEQNGGESAAPERTPEETNRLKRQYVLQELVETERDYVRDLASVVDGYMAHLSTIELPEDLQGKDKIIFANVAQILEFHKSTFCREIERCLNDYEAAGQAFVKYERRLHVLYVKYCQNKPKSDYLVSQEHFEQFFAEAKQKIGHKLALCDLLIKPVQRIMKYQLLLKDICKFTQRAGDRTDVLERALQVMHVVPKACDDMMQVGRLQNFDGNLNAQGKLIFQGTIQISDNAPSQPFKGKDRRIFLFEQSAIIADCILPKKEFGNPTYIFKNQIMVNKMNLEVTVPGEPLRFLLKSSDPSQPSYFLCQAVSEEEKQQWINAINERLDQQREILAALVDPKRYQNQLANNVAAMSLDDARRSANPFGAKKPAASAPSPASSSPKHGGGASKKLFGFGKKAATGAGAKSPTSPPPK
uniref:Rho guanine nucleotide exchange factor 25 n=1 Tax=Steinernema glaseri TaxID=37863 RepID=A0A1I7YXS5_9BILA